MPQDSAFQAVPQDLSLHLRSSLLRDTHGLWHNIQAHTPTNRHMGNTQTWTHAQECTDTHRDAQTPGPHMQTHTNVHVRHTVRHERTGRQKVRTLDTWGTHMGTILPRGSLVLLTSEPKRLTSYSCPWLGSPQSQQPILASCIQGISMERLSGRGWTVL